MSMGKLFSFFLLAIFSLLPADELHLEGKKTREGIFLGVSDGGKISFQVYGEETPQVFSTKRVTAILLDQPVKVRFFSKRNDKKFRSGQFFGMKENCFLLHFTGEKQEREISLLQLYKLEVELDMKAYLKRMENYRLRKAETLAEQKKSAAEFLVSGRLVVLHFVSPQVSANTRQGNLAHRLCSDSMRPAQYVPVLIESLESPIARANALQSLPQFWFYTAQGTLSSKLSSRFTEEDIEAAFQKASKAN